jgi:NADH-quinone oxidoreductase subunit L
MFALYFGVEYMYREAFINRLLYLLNLFATSVIFLFFCYDYFLILFAWECIGLFSFLLVNFYSTRIYTIKAALKTFVFSRISDMFMFISFLLTIIIFNTTDLSIIFLQAPFMAFHYIFFGDIAVHFLTFFSFCLVTSGGIKAAQFFAHVWLPDAMEAPTPASALIHSSTLVVAGVFLIIRFSVIFEFTLFTNYY